MPSIQQLPQELLHRIVAAAAESDDHCDPLSLHQDTRASETNASSSIKALSETCHSLRAHALPILWSKATISISFDQLSESLRAVESFTLPAHPVRRHARALHLHIDSQHVTLNRVLLASLDLRLARAIAGMTGLQSVCVQMKTAFQFSRTMVAILTRPGLNSLTIAARGNLHIPAMPAERLEKLFIHSDVGSCRFDLAAFPSLKALSLSMEDNSSCQSWDELRFPPQLWSTLEKLSLRGFVLDPLQPLGRLNESLRSAEGSKALKAVYYHLARDEQDATYAWQTLSQLPLTTLSFTVSFLFDARYARRMVQAFPHLENLELFAFSRAAAWQWPDPFDAYIQAFASLTNLGRLGLNHNDLTTASLPLSVPTVLPGSIPAASAFPVVEPTNIEPTPTSSSSNDDVGQAHSAEDEDTADEPVVLGPLGMNFCPNTSPDDLEKQAQTAAALFRAIPTLRQVSFEPGLTERANSNPNPFGYKISQSVYQRISFCF